MVHGRPVGVVHLHRVVAAALEGGELIVAQMGDHLLEFRCVEELLPDETRVALLGGVGVFLIFAVRHLEHPAGEGPACVAGEKLIPFRAPDALHDVPAGALEDALEFLDDLAVAAHRAVEALQVAVDDEDQVVELFPGGNADTAERFGFVALAVAEVGPDVRAVRLGQAPAFQVAGVAGLIDRHDRANAHAHGRILPEVGHQPGVRIAGQPAAGLQFPAEVRELLLVQPALDKGPGVRPGGGVSLEVDDVAVRVVGPAAEEVVEADFVQRGGGLVGGDVAADVRGLVRLGDHGHGVPANDALDLAFQRPVAGVGNFLIGGDGVHVGRVDATAGALDAGRPDFVLQGLQQERGPLRSLDSQDGLDGFQPLGGFRRVDVHEFRRKCRATNQVFSSDDHRARSPGKSVGWS